MQDNAASVSNDNKINLILALPGCPPVLNYEEGLEMEQLVIKIQNRIETLLITVNAVNQKCKDGNLSVITSMVKELEKTQKEYMKSY